MLGLGRRHRGSGPHASACPRLCGGTDRTLTPGHGLETSVLRGRIALAVLAAPAWAAAEAAAQGWFGLMPRNGTLMLVWLVITAVLTAIALGYIGASIRRKDSTFTLAGMLVMMGAASSACIYGVVDSL